MIPKRILHRGAYAVGYPALAFLVVIAALPVAATLVLVLGLTLIHAVPFLHDRLPRVRMLDALSSLAVIFLGMAAMVYPWGLWCLWRLPPPVRPPS